MSVEIMIVKDGEIVEILPKADYDKKIINEFNQFLNEPIVSVEKEPSKTTTIETVKPSNKDETVSSLLQDKLVNPLQGLTIQIIFGLILSLVVAFVYQHKTKKKVTPEGFKFITAIIIGLIVLNFLRKLM